MPIFEISEQSGQSISHKLDDMWEYRQKYDAVYVSIGSKLNDPNVHFNNHINMQNKNIRTNASAQMIPNFIRSADKDKIILVIIIDDFQNSQKLHQNHCLLSNIVDEKMDVLIVNNYCTQTFLENFINGIANMWKNHNIDEKNVMICNFVKFSNNPNTMEEQAEKMIPKTIQSVLDRPEFKRYSNCFYEWFGYKYYLYNFIYNYKKCRMSFNAYEAIHSLEKYIERQYTNTHSGDEVIQNINTIGIWANIYDITTMTSGQHGMAISFKDYLLENGQLDSFIC